MRDGGFLHYENEGDSENDGVGEFRLGAAGALPGRCPVEPTPTDEGWQDSRLDDAVEPGLRKPSVNRGHRASAGGDFPVGETTVGRSCEHFEGEGDGVVPGEGFDAHRRSPPSCWLRRSCNCSLSSANVLCSAAGGGFRRYRDFDRALSWVPLARNRFGIQLSGTRRDEPKVWIGVSTVRNMSIPGGTLRFERPPVRGVALTVYFAQIRGLLLTSLAPLVAEVKKDFPVVSERFAELPWKYDTEDDAPIPLPEDDAFPFPYLSFGNGSGHAVNFQDDRFRLTWTFSDGADYPGFDELSRQLGVHLDTFAEHVRSEAGADVSISHVSVQYENQLGDTAAPIDIALRAHGVQCDAVASETAQNVQEPTFHATMPFEFDGGTAEVYLLSRRDDNGTMLGLRSTARLPEPADTDWRALLHRAHDNLISTFDRATSMQQKTDWGIIE